MAHLKYQAGWAFSVGVANIFLLQAMWNQVKPSERRELSFCGKLPVCLEETYARPIGRSIARTGSTGPKHDTPARLSGGAADFPAELWDMPRRQAGALDYGFAELLAGTDLRRSDDRQDERSSRSSPGRSEAADCGISGSSPHG